MVPRGPADAPAATTSDRFYFNCFRATVGVVVLGLVVATLSFLALLALRLGLRLWLLQLHLACSFQPRMQDETT